MIIKQYESYLNNISIIQGEVVDNNDPLRKSRLKIKIEGMNENIPVDDLPWWNVLQITVNSSLRVPPIGARVIIQWIDPYNSIILGAISQTPC